MYLIIWFSFSFYCKSLSIFHALVSSVCHYVSVIIETIKRGAFGQNEMLFLCLDNNFKCNNHIFRCFVLAFWLIFTHAIMFTIFKRILSICIIFAVKQMAAAWKVLLKYSNSIGHVLQKVIFHHRETLSLYSNRSVSLSFSLSLCRAFAHARAILNEMYY